MVLGRLAQPYPLFDLSFICVGKIHLKQVGQVLLMYRSRQLRSIALWLIVVQVIGILVACDNHQPRDDLREGQLFPPLHFTGLDRADLEIDTLRGRWVVLNVWATWCGPCRKELGSLQQLSSYFPRQSLQVIGLNVDADSHNAREFMRDEAILFANYSDPEMTIAQNLLGIRAYPDTFIIAPDGTLVRSISGERDWMDAAIIAALSQAIDGHPNALGNI